MKSLTKQEWINRIDEIVKHYIRLSEICEQAQKLGMMDINGALSETIWDAFKSMLQMLDYNGWIDWHIYENDCGVSCRKAGYDGMSVCVESSETLAELIMIGLEREIKRNAN